MDSQDARIKTHFPLWHLLNQIRSDQVPQLPGTYILRLAGAKCIGRLKGVSDILYIGSTVNLRRRIYQIVHPGPTQWTNKRISKLMQKYQIEIAWCGKLPHSLDPGEFEKRLLKDYQQDHDELPPLNAALGEDK